MNDALRQGLDKLAAASRSTQPRHEVRPISQLTSRIVCKAADVGINQARKTILDWLRDKQHIKEIPDAAWRGATFEIDVAQDRPVSVEAFEGLWAMRYDNPDAEVAGRYWRTEAILGHINDSALLGIRLSIISRSWEPTYYPSVPVLVRSLVQSPGLEDYGWRLLDRALPVFQEDDAPLLAGLLENPARTRPVYIVPVDRDSEGIIDPDLLAQRTAGLAHVVRLYSNGAWGLSRLIGDRLSIYGKAVRVYYPGFERLSARFEDHPLYGIDWLRRRYSDPKQFIGMLSTRAINASVSSGDLEQRLPSFSRVRQTIAARRLDAAKKAHAPDVEMMRLYEQDNNRLSEDLKTAEGLLVESDHRQKLIEEERDEMRRQVYALRARIDHLQSAIVSRGSVESTPTPDTLDGVEDWVQQHLGDGLVLLPRALRSLKKSQYLEVPKVYEALILLGRDYRNLRLQRMAADEMERTALEMGFEISSTGSHASLMQWREDYEVVWRRENRLLDMHLKKGTAREPRHCLRIYFFWDEDTEQVVVGHLPDHLCNDLT
jgi:hypothetical protein